MTAAATESWNDDPVRRVQDELTRTNGAALSRSSVAAVLAVGCRSHGRAAGEACWTMSTGQRAMCGRRIARAWSATFG